MKKSRYQDYRWMAGLFVLLMFLLSCESKDKYVGVYQAQVTVVSKARRHYPRAEGKRRWSVESEFS